MSSFKNVWSEIKKHKRILVTTHHNPDADAACSALAMTLVLKKMGKITTLVDEDALPSWLDFLPGAKTFYKNADIKPPVFDLVIALDCGDRLRIGGVSKLINGQKLINIDHHISNDLFGDVNLVLLKSSSTCEILFDLFRSAKVKLTKDLAVLLYAGIMTDTGSFRYDNTTAKTHEIIVELMRFGLNPADLYQRLYVGIPSSDIKKFIDVIHSADLVLKNQVYCVMLPKKVVDSFSKGFDLKEKIFGFLRSVEGIEVVVILHEIASHLTRINLRSQNDFDVSQLASLFQGGGHRKAAGAKTDVGLEESKKKILAAIRRSL
ncbi:MAG: bifunctional oligoribonuclease/PAP phosphatase NrnA [Candidatus Omnitrophica bacterium]|nr:bifunctional oligoribonuclease/PAP phosphatase NrnA [Candidatus Omnitrophota bacterium]